MATAGRTLTIIQSATDTMRDLRIQVLTQQTLVGAENNINFSNRWQEGYIAVGRWHEGDDHGETRIYYGKAEVTIDGSSDIVKGLTVEFSNDRDVIGTGDWSKSQWEANGPQCISGYMHHGDENHSFQLHVVDVALKVDRTGEYLPISVVKRGDVYQRRDSTQHFFSAYQYHCLWTKFWRDWDGDENDGTTYGESEFLIRNVNLTELGAEIQ